MIVYGLCCFVLHYDDVTLSRKLQKGTCLWMVAWFAPSSRRATLLTIPSQSMQLASHFEICLIEIQASKREQSRLRCASVNMHASALGDERRIPR